MDQHGTVIHEGVSFAWQITDGDAALNGAAQAACSVTSSVVGLVTVEVTVVQGNVRVSDRVDVKFLENITSEDDSGGKGCLLIG